MLLRLQGQGMKCCAMCCATCCLSLPHVQWTTSCSIVTCCVMHFVFLPCVPRTNCCMYCQVLTSSKPQTLAYMFCHMGYHGWSFSSATRSPDYLMLGHGRVGSFSWATCSVDKLLQVWFLVICSWFQRAWFLRAVKTDNR